MADGAVFSRVSSMLAALSPKSKEDVWVDKPDAVTLVRKNPDAVYTFGSGKSKTDVEVVDAISPYLRIKPNGTTGDNLLSLPIY